MITFRTLFRSAVPALVAASIAAGHAVATPMVEPRRADTIVLAAGDCYAIGQQVADQYGGTLAKATASDNGGQPVCVIVVLVPAKDGQRPRREQVVVPAG